MNRYIDEHRGRFGVEPICSTLDVSASAYYQRATGQRSERVMQDERLLEVIKTTHAANYCAYGYRKMWKALGRAGHDVGRDRVKRLMRQHAIQGAKRRGRPWRTTTPDPSAAPRQSRLQRHAPRRAVGRRFHVPALLAGWTMPFRLGVLRTHAGHSFSGCGQSWLAADRERGA